MAKKKEETPTTCTFAGHKDCIVLKTGNLKVVVTTQCGPRIIGCFIDDDKENMFAVLPKTAPAGLKNGFQYYGGHRVSHAPEERPRSFQPDNTPVEVVKVENGYEFASQEPEEGTGIRKSLVVEALPNGVVAVTHILENTSCWPVELAPVAISMMAPGGKTVIPQNRNANDYPYAPDRKLVVWPYCNFGDKRMKFTENYVMVNQEPGNDSPFRMGMDSSLGWVGYALNGKLLVKYFDYAEDEEYPDGGCTVETRCAADYQELITQGGLNTLEPGETAEFVEYWQGLSGLPELKKDSDFAKYVEPQLLMVEEEDDDCGCDCGCEGEGEDEDDCDCGCGCHHHH